MNFLVDLFCTFVCSHFKVIACVSWMVGLVISVQAILTVTIGSVGFPASYGDTKLTPSDIYDFGQSSEICHWAYVKELYISGGLVSKF